MTPINLNDLQEFVVLVIGPLALLSGALTLAAIIALSVLSLLDGVFNAD